MQSVWYFCHWGSDVSSTKHPLHRGVSRNNCICRLPCAHSCILDVPNKLFLCKAGSWPVKSFSSDWKNSEMPETPSSAKPFKLKKRHNTDIKYPWIFECNQIIINIIFKRSKQTTFLGADFASQHPQPWYVYTFQTVQNLEPERKC